MRKFVVFVLAVAVVFCFGIGGKCDGKAGPPGATGERGPRGYDGADGSSAWSDITGKPAGFADNVDNEGWTSSNDGASSGLDADLLDGQHGTYYRSWSNLTGIPGGFADGVDNTGGSPSWASLTGIPAGFADGVDNTGGGGVTDHGALTGLSGDDHSQYLNRSGVRPMTGDLDMAGNDLYLEPGCRIYGTGGLDISVGTVAEDVDFWVAGTQRFSIKNTGIVVPDNAQLGNQVTDDHTFWGEFSSGSASDTHSIVPYSSGWGYVGRNGRLWWAMYATAFNTSSSREAKKNIKELTTNQSQALLDKVREVKPVTFLYNQETDVPPLDKALEGKYRKHPHLGVIAEDLPPEVLDNEGTAINVVSYTALLHAAIQELDAELAEKDARIADLESKVAALEQRMSAIDGK